MSDLNNKDPFEELFRNKTEDYDISYREEDWNKLENRLDALDAQHAARRYRQIAAAAVLLVFSLLSFFIYQNYRQIHSLNEKLEQESKIVDNPSNNGQTNEIAPENNNKQPQKDQQSPEEFANLESDESRTPINQSTGETVNNPGTGNKRTNNSSFEANTPIAGTFQIDQAECPECSSIAINTGNTGIHSRLETNASFKAQEVQNSPYSISRSSTSSQFALNSSMRSKFTAGVLLGPDFSTVGSISDFYDPGSKIGITAEYNPNRNWGISIGIIRSNVRYRAGQQEYRPPQDYWYNGIEATSTTAECIILDIPINLSYRFLHFNNSRFYASAGLSSYIMLTEDYKFNYDNSYDELPERWKEKTGTTHFFSNAGISLGYEQDLFRGISLRAEPFIRLPLREVGWGNVNLYSIGSIISVHFQLNKNQSIL